MVEAPTNANAEPVAAGAGGGEVHNDVLIVEEIPMPSLEEWTEALTTDDETDPNYRHRDALKKVHAAYNDLPEGWTRARDSHGRHVFHHGPSGRTSFRNPARENVKRVLADLEAENPEIWGGGDEAAKKAAKVKKLRRMIRVGTPRWAVEHQAKMDGIDMDAVVTETEEESDPPKSGGGGESGGENNRGNAEHERELRVLRKMLSSGVPLPAVRQRARLKGIVDPALLAEDSSAASSPRKGKGDGSETQEKKRPKIWKRPTEDDVRQSNVRKLRKMIKVGTPMWAVEHQAKMDGIDMEVVKADCPSKANELEKLANERELRRLRKMLSSGVPPPAVQQMARLKGVDPDLIFESEGNEEEEKEKADDDDRPLFRLVDGRGDVELVEFDPSDSLLASVVRKSVQTLKGRGSRPESSLAVELRKDLYNALGILRAVRRERDEYNSAGGADDDPEANPSDDAPSVRRERDEYNSAGGADDDPEANPSDVRALRRPFLDRFSSVGVRPPVPDEGGRVDVPGLDDLIRFVETHCADMTEARRAMVAAGTYDFNSLGEWFRPGVRVVARNAFSAGADVLCEVTWSNYEEGRSLFGITRRFRAGFRFFAAVGGEGKFAPVEFSESMENFDGSRDVRTLPFVPVEALGESEAGGVLAGFRKRGEMYKRCAVGANFLRYSEGSFFPKAGGGAVGRSSSSFGSSSHASAQRTSGRVVVDCQGSYEAGHSVSVGYDPMVEAIQTKYKEYVLHLRRTKQSSSSKWTGAASDDDGMVLFSSLPDHLLAMTWPALVGFSFTSKAWGDILVDGLSDIDFNDSAFDRLVLPPARKRMIKALVRHSSGAFSDIIAGKGEGSVFLLYGPPGCGKTLTAEAMSEMLHRPLYTVTLGQLGTSPAELETKLGDILALCGRWDALVLLDEADIFLEKRTSSSAGGSSLERNAMVSVMLRLVEYFRGVLFLTSNRVDVLDSAFKTRITLALRYEPLGKDARARVWTNLLEASAQGDALEEGRIVPSELARHELNGREIKNAIRLAMALAEEDGEPLGQKYIEETAELLMEFNAKMDAAEAY
eukprot:CAMPEP_0197468342 /NCGR_PEP_ID=MMETSP1175-20131217/66030_1 /TAXON_ID=1003142 /ORGANISM="Triceratium dubium, Strain CCMP147" /LENGTH=1056 /DNA_ID=CAMNT_0043004439 /DNA_START=70 /DNA_END=3241 /DNA_ORIENTATION=+